MTQRRRDAEKTKEPLRLCVSASRSIASSGITLVEMMVVMSVIALMVAVSAPSLSAGIDSVRISSATNLVAAFLNAAVNLAERKQQPVQLIISPRNSTLSLLSNDPASRHELKLPDGIVIENILPRTEEPEFRLILMPGTAVPGIGIQIANGRGARRIVKLDPMTGFPHVESVQ